MDRTWIGTTQLLQKTSDRQACDQASRTFKIKTKESYNQKFETQC